MHHMLIGIVLHTTLLAIVGYALLWSASKAEGLVALIGRVLGIWVFILAILSVVAIVVMPKSGEGPFGMDIGHGMHRWGPPGPPGMMPPPPPPAGQPAPPAPAPAKP